MKRTGSYKSMTDWVTVTKKAKTSDNPDGNTQNQSAENQPQLSTSSSTSEACKQSQNTDPPNKQHGNKSAKTQLRTVLKWSKELHIPWLRYEIEKSDGANVSKIWCEICKEHSTELTNQYRFGTKNVRRESVVYHLKSTEHKRANTEKIAKEQLEKRQLPPIESSMKNLDDKTFRKMGKLFRTSMYIAVMERPFSDFPHLVELQNKNGAEIGENYKNDKAARQFIDEIAGTYRDKLKEIIKSADYFSVMTDSSTDRSESEKEIVMIRVIDDDYPKILCLGLIDVQNAKADGIFQAIQTAFELYDFGQNFYQKLVGYGADGASVNLGRRRSVSTLLRENSPWLVQIHCFAHRLELGMKDAFKKTYTANVIELLTSMYYFFKNSPKRIRECTELADIMDEHFSAPNKANGTRWVDHKMRALTKLKLSYHVITTYLQHYSEDKSNTADDRAKARGYLKNLRQHKFVFFMHFCLDVFNEVAKLSLIFQRDDIMVSSAVTKLKATKNMLQIFSDQNGHNLNELERDIQREPNNNNAIKYKGTKLLNVLTNVQMNEQKQEVLTNLQQCLTDRFLNAEEEPIFTSCMVFDPKNWPQENLAMYGEAEITFLFEHFSTILNACGVNLETALSEWEELKLLVRNPDKDFRGLHPLVIWRTVSKDDAVRNEFQQILKIIHLTAVYPLSTSACERGFSLMNRVKSDWRAKLNTQTLNSIMTISHNMKKENLQQWDPSQAVNRWWLSGERTRRANLTPKN